MSMLGAYIKELRKKNDLSLRELAKRLGGMSAAFLSDIELGRRYPSDEVLAKMATQLGVTLEDMKKRDARLPMPPLNFTFGGEIRPQGQPSPEPSTGLTRE